MLEGEAGIGKTTIWRLGAADAAGRSYTVLSCRPAESEAALSFLPGLPPDQVVTLLYERAGRLELGLAQAGAIRELAQKAGLPRLVWVEHDYETALAEAGSRQPATIHGRRRDDAAIAAELDRLGF